MSANPYPNINENGAGDSQNRKGSIDTNTPVESTRNLTISESTLLTPAQTYFADERIQIPDSDVSVCIVLMTHSSSNVLTVLTVT